MSTTTPPASESALLLRLFANWPRSQQMRFMVKAIEVAAYGVTVGPVLDRMCQGLAECDRNNRRRSVRRSDEGAQP